MSLTTTLTATAKVAGINLKRYMLYVNISVQCSRLFSQSIFNIILCEWPPRIPFDRQGEVAWDGRAGVAWGERGEVAWGGRAGVAWGGRAWVAWGGRAGVAWGGRGEVAWGGRGEVVF